MLELDGARCGPPPCPVPSNFCPLLNTGELNDQYPLLNKGEELNESRPALQRKRAKSGGASSAKRAFAKPKTLDEIEQAKKSAIPVATMKDTKYCLGVWNEWRNYRLEVFGDDIPPIEDLEVERLASYLSDFVQ